MTEPVLGPEDLTAAHRERGHRMAQPVETHPDQVSPSAQLGEPVAHGAGRETPWVVDVGR